MRGEHNRLRDVLSLAALAAVAFFVLPSASASTTDGTIDVTNRYAWSENIGWIDFGSTEGNVHVTDTALSGYAWGENAGWISLNCSNDTSCATVDFKVTNDGAGTLGGYAWSENTGWIDFDPVGGGVTISSSGIFSGYAWGENVGWISFNCSDESSCATVDYKVSTDWRPLSVRAVSSSSVSTEAATGGGGGGGGTRPATLNNRLERAKTAILVRFEGSKKESERMIAEEEEREEKDRVEISAKQREERIAARIATAKSAVARLKQEQEELGKRYAERREERLNVALAQKEQEMLEKQVALRKEQEALQQEREENRKERERRIAAEQKEKKNAVVRRKPATVITEAVALRRNRLYVVVDASPVLYKDVPLDAWYSPYVSYVIEEKIAQGYRDEEGKPKGEFGVGNPVTYAEVLKMALEAAGTMTESLPPPRNVSAKGTWASAYVAKAEAMSLAVYAPDLEVSKPATRGAVIRTVLEVLGVTIGKTSASYEDVPKNHPHSPAIAAATFFGLVQGDLDMDGKPLNRFRPDDEINRAEVAKIIALAKELTK